MASLLAYIDRFHPGTGVVLADGSNTEQQAMVAAIAEKFSERLQVEFRPYPTTLPLFERLVDVLRNMEDETLAMGADDDFPLLDVYGQADIQLQKDASLISVVPADIVVRRIAGPTLSSRLYFSRSMLDEMPVDRLKRFAARSFATSYGVTRRSALLERYASLAKYYCAGFIDFQIGALDAVQGKVLAMEQIGCIRTYDENEGHLRPVEPLIFVRRSEQLLRFRDDIARRLSTSANESTAMDVAIEIIERRVLELIGPRNQWQSQPHKKVLVDDPLIRRQADAMASIFTEGTAARDLIGDRLRYVVDRLPPWTDRNLHRTQANYEIL